MNHEIDFYPDDIYIREFSLQFSVHLSFFKRGKTLYWMQVNCVLSPCLGKQPLQTSCLSEALTSSALRAMTGSGRLFISFFFTESPPWLIWRRLKTCSVIYSRDCCIDGRHIWLLCVWLEWQVHTTCQRLIILSVFLNTVSLWTLMHELVQVNCSRL